jgi:hypothetical protein
MVDRQYDRYIHRQPVLGDGSRSKAGDGHGGSGAEVTRRAPPAPEPHQREELMDGDVCNYDTEAMAGLLPQDALFICPVCAHWVHAGRPHRTEFVGEPVDIDAWVRAMSPGGSPWFDDREE